MKRCFAPAAITAAGLLTAQAIFSLFVYQSNTDLLKSLEALDQAGYLIVPNARVMASLDTFLPAFCGGLFFTLTAGAGLVLGTFILIYLWRFVLAGRPEVLLILVILWELGLYKAAQTDAPMLLTALFILMPLLVFALTMAWSKSNKSGEASGWRLGLTHLAAVLLIAGIWMPNVNADVFVNIRDQLLLSNPAGRTVNSFYYRYTLYPAEAFKALHQKQLKTVRIQINDPRLSRQAEKSLRRLDYLSIASDVDTHLTVRSSAGKLLLSHEGKNIQEVQVSRFLADPKETLKSFSQKTDQMQFLRKFTFFSLIIASPLLLYFFIHWLVSGFFFFIRKPVKRSVLAAFACVLLAAAGASAVYPLQSGTQPKKSQANLGSELRSDKLDQRLRALKRIDEKDLPISGHESTLLELGKSSAVAERYWTAKVLDNSHSAGTYRMLSRLLHDPHPNVVCMALYSLGNRDDDRAIEAIKHVLKISGHWYVQWYAYNALKELGWIQPESV
jgi:hypothetical protein